MGNQHGRHHHNSGGSSGPSSPMIYNRQLYGGRSMSENGDSFHTMTGSYGTPPHVHVTASKLPTVFKWPATGGDKNIYLSGSFDDWKSKMPMVKSQEQFCQIVDLEEGEHEYKFLVDGEWKCNPKEAKKENNMGSENNVVTVKASDFEVFEALEVDSLDTPHGIDGGSPPGEYTMNVPDRVSSSSTQSNNLPPVLPPHLLQVILNKDIPVHCEPTLLPEPNHVMLNHLYALSIKDGVMVLSATHRYRKKYVTTLLYKPT